MSSFVGARGEVGVTAGGTDAEAGREAGSYMEAKVEHREWENADLGGARTERRPCMVRQGD